MEDVSPILQALFRWGHIIAGITWIGLLYFFNWVNAPLQLVLSGDTKKAVNPELLPRALFWFRWGAAWTWLTGVLLLLLVFSVPKFGKLKNSYVFSQHLASVSFTCFFSSFLPLSEPHYQDSAS